MQVTEVKAVFAQAPATPALRVSTAAYICL